MAERESKTYGLHGETETRLQGEFDKVYKTMTAAQLEIKFTLPNVQTMPKGKPFIAKDGANWYIYVRIEDAFYRTAALTAV